MDMRCVRLDLLGLQSGGVEVSIPHELRIIHTNYRALQDHLSIVFSETQTVDIRVSSSSSN